jgi:surface antigen
MNNVENLPQRNYGSYAIAVSVLCLSISIFYFATQLSSLEKVAESMALYRDVAPELVHEVAQVSENIPIIINEVTAVRDEVPAILAEIAAVRLQIPAVLAEVNALRLETIPAVLAATNTLQTTTLPTVIAESKALRSQTVPVLIAESTALREKTIPAVLTQMQKTREELPGLLAQANDIARSAGKSASEGAVSGIFSGIISAPINLVNGVTGSIFKGKSLSEQERNLIAIASSKVLSKDYLQASETWSSNVLAHSGTVTITAMSVNGDERCRSLTIKDNKINKPLASSVFNVCHNSAGKWAMRE